LKIFDNIILTASNDSYIVTYCDRIIEMNPIQLMKSSLKGTEDLGPPKTGGYYHIYAYVLQIKRCVTYFFRNSSSFRSSDLRCPFNPTGSSRFKVQGALL
jgi:hypothetical protein